jgi:predicted dehydrogenase
MTKQRKKRYAQVGLGGRHSMFREAIFEKHAERAEYVGVCDSNLGRVELAKANIKNDFGKDVPGYDAKEFDRMIAEVKPDCVIVTTMDSKHHEYICRAMELGCDVITEKPMTIDAEKCRKILETEKATGKNCTVTFNYRYAPPRTQIKHLLMSGVIGNILSVDFHWMLNLSHGADYFRRWHRNKKNSGGLMVHKATHHFDLINWWLSTVPDRVFASGHRRFYTPETANNLGLVKRTERCHDCPEADNCNFHLDLAQGDSMKKLYLDCEQYDGYFRDRCVFSPDIDIEDSMNVIVDYRNGAKMTYSLNAFMPWEGYTVTFNGSTGRIEHKCEESVYINADDTVPGMLKKEGTWTRVYPHWATPYEVEIWQGEGGHGGADPVMLDYIFAPEEQATDNYMRAADQRAGAWSILTGIAANHAMRENRPVRIDELVSDIPLPDYPVNSF